MEKNILTNFCASLKSAREDVGAICVILFRGKNRYLYNELHQKLSIGNTAESGDELIATLLDLLEASSLILKTLNFPDDRKHLKEALSAIKEMTRNNSRSVTIQQENDMLLNQLKTASASTDQHTAEFIATLDDNTGLLNILEEISQRGPDDVTIEPKELQPLLSEVFNKFTAAGLKRILNTGDVKSLPREELKDVKIIGENIDLEKDKFILANKGWQYKQSIITEAILRKRG